MIQKFYSILYDKWFSHNDPYFIIAGVQKSGTTSLYHYLNHHTELCGSKPKEVHYFNRDYYFDKPYASYRSHFSGSNKNIYFEATPAYIYQPNAMENLKLRYPDIKLIIILREPTSRAFSAWNHYRDVYEKNKGSHIKNKPRREGNLLYEMFYNKMDKFPSFRECIEIEIQLMEEVNPPFEPSLLRRGLYYQQIRKCYDLFPINNCMILGFQDLIIHPKETIGKICEFVGVIPFVNDLFIFKAINKKKYKDKIYRNDQLFLNSFYEPHNKKLIELIGNINW